MRRPSKRTVADAVLVCRVIASRPSDGSAWPRFVASDLFGGRRGVAAAKLANGAECEVWRACGLITSRGSYAHTADLLESGWLPGDPLVQL